MLLSHLWHCESKTFHLGVLFPWQGFLPVGSKGGGGGGVNLAVDEINNNTKSAFPMLQSGYHRLNFSWADTQCDAAVGLPLISDMYYGDGFQPVDAFIGPGCSVICEPGGLLVSKWKVPMVSYGSTSSKMSDKKLYPTFARVQAPNAECAPLLVKMMQSFGYDRVAIFFSTENIWSLTASAIRDHLIAANILITEYFTFERGSAGSKRVNGVLQLSAHKSRGRSAMSCFVTRFPPPSTA